MIRLHDRTRRRIAVTIFLTLGLAPSLAIAAWGLWWRSAWYVASEAQRLGWRFGLIATLGDVRHPAPGEVIYEDVAFSEPEGRQPVFRCRNLVARWEGSPSKAGGRLLRVTLSRPEILAAQWPEIWQLVNRVLTGRCHLENFSAQIVAEQLRVIGCQAPQELERVEMLLDARPEGAWLDAAFRVAGEGRGEPARLLVTRNRQRTPAATRFELDTANGALPCGLLAVALPGWDAVGPGSLFHGILRVELSPEGPGGELAGQFLGVNLETLIGDRSPHRVSGIADLAIEQARFRDGRLVEAAGSLVGGPGMVSRSLLEVAIQRLGMSGGTGIDRPDRLVPYERLAFWFACDANGIRLRGLSPGGTPGALLSGRTGAILIEPDASQPPLPIAALVQALAPEAEFFPIARQQDWLLDALPQVTESSRSFRDSSLPSSRFHALPDTDNPLR